MSLLKGWRFQLGKVPGNEPLLAGKGWGAGAGRMGLHGPGGQSGAWLGLLHQSLNVHLGLARFFHLVPFLFSSGHCQSLHEKLSGQDVMVKWTGVAQG